MNEIASVPLKTFFLTLCFLGSASVFMFSFENIEMHIFLFLDLLLSAAYAGFLLTAIPTWFEYNENLRKCNIALFLTMSAAFLCCFYDLAYARIIICIFWTILLAECNFIAYTTRNYNSVLFSATFMLIIKYVNAIHHDTNNYYVLAHMNSIIVSLVNFRISFALAETAFTDMRKENHIFIANKFYKNLSVFFIAMVCLETVIDSFFMKISHEVIGLSAMAAGVMILARLREWHYGMFFRMHYIVFFYITQALFGISYVILGIAYVTDYKIIQSLHLLAFFSTLLIITMVINIAGIRHHGLDLVFPLLSRASIIAIITAGFLRYFDHYTSSLLLTSAAFTIEFIVLLKLFKDNKFIL